jgi:hypothetical protein
MLTGARLRFDRCTRFGVVTVPPPEDAASASAPTRLELGDVDIRDTRADQTELGVGLLGQEGAELSLDRVAVTRSRVTALALLGNGTAAAPTLAARDVTVRETDGDGLILLIAGTVELARVQVEASTGAGMSIENDIAVEGRPVDLTLEDVRIVGAEGLESFGMQAVGDGDIREGLEGFRGTLTLRRGLFSGLVGTGLLVVGLASTIEDLRVEGTAPREDGTFGDGIEVVLTRGTLERIELVDNGRAGLAVFGAEVTVRDARLACNAIDLDGEPFQRGEIEQKRFGVEDLGGNACGCDGQRTTCQLLSVGLSPPLVDPPMLEPPPGGP